MLAEVIVDVPLMQTDKPFSYRIPEEFEDMIQAGIRVHVPFGKGNRLIQGIVVGIRTESEPEKVDPSLKVIAEVLDFTPVLNEEQLWLADELRHTVFSYKTTLLKAMLPNVLNSSYDKILWQTDQLPPDQARELFAAQDSVHFSDLDLQKQAQVMRLVQKGYIRVEYTAKDRRSVKTKTLYEVDQEALSQLEISNRAKRKQEAKSYLARQEGPQEWKELTSRFSAPIARYFKEEGVLNSWEEEVRRSQSYFDHIQPSHALSLNPEQAVAVREMTDTIGDESQTFLLQGITGSGKTEVYLQVIEAVLAQGKTAIVLVPEISLTPQMTHRFIARFGHQVALLHSGLSDGEKYDEWRKIESGEAQVVVGARSAVFAPLTNIGAIIIDEEHEATYKQDSNPRYHAREVALLRSNYHKASLILGSATPSLETKARASRGVYRYVSLQHRANPLATIPSVKIVDFRDYIGEQETSNFTPVLVDRIREKLAKKEQVVLLLNRRGYSSFVLCRDCGAVDECPNCDISLTLHMDTKTMNCHYCGFQKEIPRQCPQCHSSSIRYYGTGTQKAVEELQQLLPEARILRMDVDTTRKKGAHQKILDQFGRHEADILLGTQMIAKGLDFPNVTLVGVLNADTALNLPDFRASERTFQLLTQVAGRAGRAEKEGEVIIQTYNPAHYAIAFAKDQDYERFYQYEMGIRRQMAYPPYVYTVEIGLSDRSEELVIQKSYEVAAILREGLSDAIRILGPTPKPVARTHNLYHYQLILKYRFEDGLEDVLNRLLDWSQEKEQAQLRITIDHEPQNLM